MEYKLNLIQWESLIFSDLYLSSVGSCKAKSHWSDTWDPQLFTWNYAEMPSFQDDFQMLYLSDLTRKSNHFKYSNSWNLTEKLCYRLWGEWRNQGENHGAPQTLRTAGNDYFADDGKTKRKAVLLDSEMRFIWQKLDLRWTLLAKLRRRRSPSLESYLWVKREEKPSRPPVSPVPFIGWM